MKKILIFLLGLSVFLYAESIKHEVSGNIEFYNITGNMNNNYYPDDTSSINKLEAYLNNDFYYKNLSLFTSIGYIRTDGMVYNSLLTRMVNKVNVVYLNNLYLQYQINNEYSIKLGTFNFRKGTFYNYSFNGMISGDGLFNIISDVYEGIIISKSGINHSISGGVLFIDKIYDNDLIASNTSRYVFKDTRIYTMIYKRKIDNIFLELDYYNIDKHLLEKSYLKGHLIGLGVSIDNEINNGMIYYGVLSYSDVYGDNSYLINNTIEYNPYAYYGKFKNKGYSILLGSKKELDSVIFKRDVMIGGEIMYTTRGYYNLTYGKPLEAYSYANIGTIGKAYVGLRYNKDLLFKIIYCKYVNDKYSYSPGLTTHSVRTNELITGTKSSQSLSLMLYYDF